MDLHFNKIVGYSIARSMTMELITQSLESAYHTQKPSKGLISHLYLDSQYKIVTYDI